MQSIYHLPRYPGTTYKFLKYGNFAKINISFQGTPLPIDTKYMVIFPKNNTRLQDNLVKPINT